MSVYKRIVIKVGSSSLTHENGKLNLRFMERLVRIISDFMNSGAEVVLVTSGAVAVGVGALGLPEFPGDMRAKQAAAAVGQGELMSIYGRLFSEYGYKTAQLLLTRDAVDDERTRENVVSTFKSLIAMRVVPIVNENDTVSVAELEHLGSFGDNDRLSAIVAGLVEADALVLVSDIDGLYDKDPKVCDDAKLIETVTEMSEAICALAGGRGSSRGTGGMATKLEAAKLAFESGFDMFIINSDKIRLLYGIVEKKTGGTYFKVRREGQ